MVYFFAGQLRQRNRFSIAKKTVVLLLEIWGTFLDMYGML